MAIGVEGSTLITLTLLLASYEIYKAHSSSVTVKHHIHALFSVLLFKVLICIFIKLLIKFY